MASLDTLTLSVKKLELGELHWILLDETALPNDDLSRYRLRTVNQLNANAAPAWTAGYLVIRAILRGTPN